MTAFRKTLAFLLLFGILSNCFSHLMLSSSYSFNKNYIASVLCTNKDKPELHCDGKCFMDIKLKELEQKNKHDQDNLKRIIETIAPEVVSWIAPIYEFPLKKLPSHYLLKKPIATTSAIFQPPKFA